MSSPLNNVVNNSLSSSSSSSGLNQPHRRSLNRQSQSCSVCGDRAYYVFYGAVSCDSCRTFFRRQVLHSKVLSCHFHNECRIQLNTRKDCAKCRLDKCISVGMKQSLVAVGETDNGSVSHGNSPANVSNNQTQQPMPAQKKPMDRRSSSIPECLSPRLSSSQSTRTSPPPITSRPSYTVVAERIPYQQQSILPSILEGRHVNQVTSPPMMAQNDTHYRRNQETPMSLSSDSNSPSSPRNAYYSNQYCSLGQQPTSSQQYSPTTMSSPRLRDSFYDHHKYYSQTNMSPPAVSPISYQNHQVLQQERSSLDYASSDNLNSLRREATRRGSYQDHLMFQQQQQLPHHSRRHSNYRHNEGVRHHSLERSFSREDYVSHMFHNQMAFSEPETPIKLMANEVKREVTATTTFTGNAVPGVVVKNEHSFSMMRGNDNRQQNYLPLRSLSSDRSMISKRKESTEDMSTKDLPANPVSCPSSPTKMSTTVTSVLSTGTHKSHIPSRMMHPKFRRQAVTNLVVSSKDSVSGDIKESVEIKNLSSTERERMIEIIHAAKLLEKSPPVIEHDNQDNEPEIDSVFALVVNNDKNSREVQNEDEDDSHNSFLGNLIFKSAKKIISVARELKPFQVLPDADKMILLKGSIAEILFLRSARAFDKEDKSWKLPNSQLVIPLLVLQDSNHTRQLYDEYIDFIDTFDENLANDSVLINLMCAICLFSEREGLEKKEMIRCERTLYLRLLEQYVSCKFQSIPQYEGIDLYKILHQKFDQLSHMNELYEKTSVDPDNVSSLVKPCKKLNIASKSPSPNTVLMTTSVSLKCYPGPNTARAN